MRVIRKELHSCSKADRSGCCRHSIVGEIVLAEIRRHTGEGRRIAWLVAFVYREVEMKGPSVEKKSL